MKNTLCCVTWHTLEYSNKHATVSILTDNELSPIDLEKPSFVFCGAKNKEEAVIVIKGSHSPTDWLLNFAMWQRSCRHFGLNYSIHAGFHFILNQESQPTHKKDQLGLSVFERTMGIASELIENGKRIAITGHSSGGAIGCIIADALEQKYPKSIKRIVTFGQPAIGGYGFKRRF